MTYTYKYKQVHIVIAGNARQDESMKNVRIFRRAAANDEFPRYWISVQTEERDRYGKVIEGKAITASISTRLSKRAEEQADGCWTGTRSGNITYIDADLDDCWFKAQKGKEDSTYAVLFVNRLTPCGEDEPAPSETKKRRE